MAKSLDGWDIDMVVRYMMNMKKYAAALPSSTVYPPPIAL